MKDDLENRTGARAPIISRRNFIGAAAATGVAGLFSPGFVPISGEGSATAAAQIVHPTTTEEVTPFKVHVPQAALNDLKKRLANARWPERETVGDWSQGVPLQKAQALIAYWRDKYDWRRFEARINAFPQYRTQIDGVGIHFIHVRSPHQNALPIILTHGWPGSVVEFMEVIGPLSDPTRYGGRAEEAFHVVVPSLPGFGFSDKPVETGWDVNRIARAWATLMPRLGYER
jgi:epoxide hydrolase